MPETTSAPPQGDAARPNLSVAPDATPNATGNATSKPTSGAGAMVSRRIILTYLGWFSFFFLLPSLALHYDLRDRVSVRRMMYNAPGKTRYYRQHAPEFDLVFLGDSRTYCGMVPSVFDAQLGTKSLNLAVWAHWFPTQYPNYQDLIPHIPKGATVVWSIGHQNFNPIQEQVNVTYPIGFANVPTYLKWGFRPWALSENLISTLPGLDLYLRRQTTHGGIENKLAQPLYGAYGDSTSATPRPDLQAELDRLYAVYSHDPHVLSVETVRDGGQPTSVALFMDRGNYVRVEIDHAFFRHKQEELAAAVEAPPKDPFEPDPAYWNNFLAILDLFQKNGVHLVVNEIEEAPYHYRNPEYRRITRAFMKSVRAQIEARGIPTMRADFDAFTDDDYFDFNHLNSVGAPKYSQMVAAQLAPLLAKNRTPNTVEKGAARDGVQ